MYFNVNEIERVVRCIRRGSRIVGGRSRVLLVTAILAGMILPTSAVQAVQVPGEYDVAIRRATRLIEGHRQALEVPGMQVAVSVRGIMVWSRGFGVADLEFGTPVTPSTRFPIGSVSKALTSAGALVLVRSGQLDVDVPIQRYITAFPEKRWPITARQLGGHLAGIRHYVSRAEGINLRPYASVTEALDVFKSDTLLFEPGRQMHYSSYGFNLLSAVIEGAAETRFTTFMRDSVFRPLGMLSTGPAMSDSIIPHRSALYVRGRNGERVNAPFNDLSVKWASGGMLSTAEDLVRFGYELGEGRLAGASTETLLFTSQTTGDGLDTGYGFGWQVGMDRHGRRLLGHSGNLEESRAHLLMYPDDGVAIAILANTGDGIYFNEAEAQEIANLFLDVSPPSESSDDADIDAWVGLWSLEMDDPRSQGTVNAVLNLEREGSLLRGWLSVPSATDWKRWPIPLAVAGPSTLTATVIPSTHIRLELEQQFGRVSGSWRWLTSVPAPGMMRSLPSSARRGREERGRLRTIRNGYRLVAGQESVSRGAGDAPEIDSSVEENSEFPSGRYEFETNLNGSAITGTISIQGKDGNYRGSVDPAGGLSPLNIESVSVEGRRIVITTTQGLTFDVTFSSESFEGTITVGGEAVPVTGRRVQ